MEHDKEFWDKYADENESRNNEEFTKFVTDLARSLHCTSVLEIGCGTGVDLRKFDDSSIDFIFTHKLLNYLSDQTLDNGVSEMFRVTKRYIVNCELFGEDETVINDEMKYRNMLKRWLNYKVKVVSNVNMHEEIEPEQARFTLLRKM